VKEVVKSIRRGNKGFVLSILSANFLINRLVSFLWHLSFTLIVLDNFTTFILVYLFICATFFPLNIGSH
jgi:hypothetical protein